MKLQFKLIWLCTFLFLMVSCSDDEGLQEVSVGLPADLEAKITLTQDNSGLVTVEPTAQNTNSFFIDYGDGSSISDTLSPGNSFSHIYSEGNFDMTIFASNVSGETSSISKPIEISFLTPENLEINLEKDQTNPFLVRVSPTADLANGFEVDFGVENESPITLNIGETAEFIYPVVGDFTVEVIALSGGSATLTLTENISIFDPLVLPIDFESETVDYSFSNFGGGEGAGVPIVDNPNQNEINNSPKVASYTKVQNSETFAGTVASLNEPVDFSATSSISVDVYSPEAGTPILLKVENANNADLSSESTQNTTVGGEWETLTFTFDDLDPEVLYSKLVLFFNFDTPGTGETYFFDNIELADPFVLGLPIDFEAGANFYSFIEFGGAPTQVVDNPDPSGINTSPSVAEFFKVDGANLFAGSFVDMAEPVDFSISETITMDVLSPEAGSEMILKFEDPSDNTRFVELIVPIPEAGVWTEVTFDFSTLDTLEGLSRMVLLFDINQPGVGKRYYFDNIRYVQ